MPREHRYPKMAIELTVPRSNDGCEHADLSQLSNRIAIAIRHAADSALTPCSSVEIQTPDSKSIPLLLSHIENITEVAEAISGQLHTGKIQVIVGHPDLEVSHKAGHQRFQDVAHAYLQRLLPGQDS